MAKKKLFGNKSEPRCETCALGKPSSDGSVVLCRRGGALPTYHHCNHFRYDPLKRIPHRQKPLNTFEAADFALDEADEWIEVATGVADKTAPDDTHAQLLRRLRAYLNSTASPDVQTILNILAEDPNAVEDDKAILLAEAQTLATADDTREEESCTTDPSEPVQAQDALSIETEELVVAEADEGPVLIPDDSADIFGDLKRLTATMNTSGSAAAALRDFTLHLIDDDKEENDTEMLTYIDDSPAGTTFLTLSDDDYTDEDDVPEADNIILLSDDELAGDDTDALTVSEDDIVTTGPAN